MSHTTNVISIGEINVQPGSGYFATLDMSFLQPESTVSRVSRDTDAPIVTNVALGLHVYYLNALVLDEGATADEIDARRRALLRQFDPTRGPLTVVVENATGTPRRRFMQFVPRKADQSEGQGGKGFLVALEATDEVRWRSTTLEEVTWTLDESGATSLTVAGDLDAYPTYTLTPNTSKTAPNWPYRRLILVQWRSPLGGRHPIDVTGGGVSTAALLSAGKITDGSNMAVMMNGTIRRHWYPDTVLSPGDAFGTAQTKIWIDMEFQPAIYPRLSRYASASATTWQVEDDYGLPQAGTLKVDNEYVTYTSRAPGFLYGVARGRFGTTAAAHDAGADIIHYQGVGWLLYGPTAQVPESMKNTAYRTAQAPVFVAYGGGSSNTIWNYQGFSQPPRSGGWSFSSFINNIGFVKESDATTGAYDASWAYPWTALGLRAGWTSLSVFSLRTAVPLKSMRAQLRQMMRTSPTSAPNVPVLWAWSEDLKSGRPLWTGAGLPWTGVNQFFDIESPEVDVFDPEFDTPYNRIRWSVAQASYMQVDIRQAWIRFDDRMTPAVSLSIEDTEYDLNLTIENATTGESLTVQYPNMAPGESLVIDSQWQTVTYSADGSNQYQAVQRDAPRPKFLRLAPGVNEFQITETGMGEMEIKVSYRPRWYA
jgi:hypothetical protein